MQNIDTTMAPINKNNHIAIAKAIGIILMVVGHSGCPNTISRFIYIFHMPLFFVFSGYFFKEVTTRGFLRAFTLKKINGLYLPYLKWSLLFLLLHNLFCSLNIYNALSNTYPYQINNYLIQLRKILFMTDYELLLRPFWFIKELLLSSLCVAAISLARQKYFSKLTNIHLLIITLLLALLFKRVHSIPLIGDVSLCLFSIAYIYSGMIFYQLKHYISSSYKIIIATFIIVLIGCQFLNDTIDMRYINIYYLFPYYLLSLCGIILVYCISVRLERTPLKISLYYIGNHTFPILALNLLALKIGNLIKILIYGMQIEKLSSYTVIHEYNSYYWIIYSIIGTGLPLLIYNIFNICRKNLRKVTI